MLQVPNHDIRGGVNTAVCPRSLLMDNAETYPEAGSLTGSQDCPPSLVCRRIDSGDVARVPQRYPAGGGNWVAS